MEFTMDNKNNSVIEYIRGTIPRFIKGAVSETL